MCLGILSFLFAHNFLYGARPLLMGVGVVTSTGAYLYSHGSGFMLFVSLFVYFLVYLKGESRTWKRSFQWAFVQLVLLILYSPWLVHARSIKPGHLLAPNLYDITETLFTLLLGFGTPYPAWLRWVVVIAAIMGVTVLFMQDTKSRGMIISFLIAPIVFCLLVSYTIRPIWHHRTLAYTVPFWISSLSCAIVGLMSYSRQRSRKAYLLTYACPTAAGLFLALALAYQTQTFSHLWDFRSAARFVREAAQPRDIIRVPYYRVFWGWNWYFIGPGSVNPLTTTYYLVTEDGITIVSAPWIDEDPRRGQTYWQVYRVNEDPPQESDSEYLIKNFRHLIVERFQASY